MAKLIVEIPDNLHTTLKKQALASGKTIKAIMLHLVNNFLGQQSQQTTTSKSGTGFCGRWEDSRGAESIIRDIYSRRSMFKSR